ncbi:aspartyl-phosphate phosphatase Spo0E family protein [Pelosinus fermentans]|uniref:Sporulation stage 0, Spo0E-like regulatory phosphatase n=1 Tax=Pelosinus fermentans JBW45 TaxID=1192197 RepID=I8TRM9_9FIRM|nr:aspartyl-phosphate phosphatase Spo0E family protein [Pelosinus fermentans]AJQ25573.1 Sporulation stage 0, Spo0E-like regulatory phosphatase [Pelosinus fermentans JBW45]
MVISDINLKELQEEIERMRLNLIHIVAKKGPVSTEALKISRDLDNKIKDYYQYKR